MGVFRYLRSIGMGGVVGSSCSINSTEDQSLVKPTVIRLNRKTEAVIDVSCRRGCVQGVRLHVLIKLKERNHRRVTSSANGRGC